MSELVEYLTTNEPQFRRARLPALYSDFRHLRTTNPDGFTANVEAWQKALTDAARDGRVSRQGTTDHLVLNVNEELCQALDTKEWGRPLALGTVVRDAVTRRSMIPLKEYTSLRDSVYRKSWTAGSWQVVAWGLRQLGLAGGEQGEDKLPVGKLVLVPNLESAAKAFTRKADAITTRIDRIYSLVTFKESFGSVLGDHEPLSATDTEVFLKYLSRDAGMIAYDGQTVKILQSMQDDAVITQEDSTIASLKTLMADLNKQVESLGERVDTFSKAAREAVARKNRISAIASLRSKKLAETNLARQTAVLDQLEDVYAKIEQAVDQVELVRVIEGSTSVLKRLNVEIGGVERVDRVMDDLQEQMTQVNEIGTVIAEPGMAAGVVDEEEVDEELAALETEERRKVEVAERLRREEIERQETAITRERLDALAAAESDARWGQAAAMRGSQVEQADHENELEESLTGFKRLSLEEEPTKEPA